MSASISLVRRNGRSSLSRVRQGLNKEPTTTNGDARQLAPLKRDSAWFSLKLKTIELQFIPFQTASVQLFNMGLKIVVEKRPPDESTQATTNSQLVAQTVCKLAYPSLLDS